MLPCRVYSALSTLGHWQYDYIAITNDGVRGPFINETAAKRVQDGLRRQGTPIWLAEIVKMFEQNRYVGMAGSQLSCERDLHLQGWWHIVRGDHRHFVINLYRRRVLEVNLGTLW